MNWNGIGVSIGLSLFLGIWLGHVLVRKMEFHLEQIQLPALLFFLLGFGCELVAVHIQKNIASGVLGVLGMTLMWDGLELFRQQKRVQQGHAVANPANPRHMRILERYPTATTKDPFEQYISRKPLDFFTEIFEEGGRK